MKVTNELRSEVFQAVYPSLCGEYERQLAALPFTKKQRGDMLAGFQDGLRSGILGTLRAVEEFTKEDSDNA